MAEKKKAATKKVKGSEPEPSKVETFTTGGKKATQVLGPTPGAAPQ